MVVDDDREIRDLLARFLEEKHQMRVTAVRDATKKDVQEATELRVVVTFVVDSEQAHHAD